jgi:hypothetical protein
MDIAIKVVTDRLAELERSIRYVSHRRRDEEGSLSRVCALSAFDKLLFRLRQNKFQLESVLLSTTLLGKFPGAPALPFFPGFAVRSFRLRRSQGVRGQTWYRVFGIFVNGW